VNLQQQQRLQQTSRLITMGEMASSLAHELNQPLSAIANYNMGCVNRLQSGEYRVEDILAPLVGPGNARVQIAADIDFSQAEQTAETHRPNTTPPDISIRSQQTSETASTNPSAQGVPGALTNQPPVPATAPLTQPPAAGATAGKPPAPIPGQINAAGVQAPIGSVGQPLSTSKNSTINYEVDKTVRHVKQALGTIKRLSAAVVVNQRKESGKDGKLVNKPWPDEEIKQLNGLVKEAMGFSNERGDTLSIANAPFTLVEKDEGLPVWRDPETRSTAVEVFKYAAIAAIIAYLLLGVVRPLLRTMLPPPPVVEPVGAQVDVMAGDEDEEIDEEEGEEAVPTAAELLEKKLAELRALAQQDPHIVAAIIKEWMGANGS
jgi:flagellar M-ring protein FliF